MWIESVRKIEPMNVASRRNQFFKENWKYFDDWEKQKDRKSPRAEKKKKEFFDMIKDDKKYENLKKNDMSLGKNWNSYKKLWGQNTALEMALSNWDILEKIKKNEWIWQNKTTISTEKKDILNKQWISESDIQNFQEKIPAKVNINEIELEQLPALINQSKTIIDNDKQYVENTLKYNNLAQKIEKFTNPSYEINQWLIRTFNSSASINLEEWGIEISKALQPKFWNKLQLTFNSITDEKQRRETEAKFYQNVYVVREALKWPKSADDIAKINKIKWFKEYFDNFVDIFNDLWINIKDALDIDINVIYEQIWSDRLKNLTTKSLDKNWFYNKFLSEDIRNITNWKNENPKEINKKNEKINKEYLNYSLNCLKSTFDINTDYQWDRNMLNDFRIKWSNWLDFQEMKQEDNDWYNLILNWKLNKNDIKLCYNIQTWDVYIHQYLWKNNNNKAVINKNLDNNYKKADLIKLPSQKEIFKNISTDNKEDPKKYFQNKSQEFVNSKANNDNKIFFDKYIEESKAQDTFMKLLWEKSKDDITSTNNPEMFQNYSYIIDSISNMTSGELRKFEDKIWILGNAIENKSDLGWTKKTISTEIYKKFNWIEKWSSEWIKNIFYILKECSTSDANLDDKSIKNLNIKKLEYLTNDINKKTEDQENFSKYPYLSDKRDKTIDIENAEEWAW